MCSQLNMLLPESCERCIYILINVKKILTVINATYAVAKRKPEKIRLFATA